MAAAYSRKTLASTIAGVQRRLGPAFYHVLSASTAEDRHTSSSHPNPHLKNWTPIPAPPFSFFGSRFHSPSCVRYYSSSSPSSNQDAPSEISLLHSADVVLSDLPATASTPHPVQVTGEVAVAAADSFFPVAALQHVMDAIHFFTGLEWWASIVLTTVMIRTATLPLMINQLKSTTKLNVLRPELEALKNEMQNSMDPETVKEGQKKMNDLFKKHGVTPFTPLKGMFIQGPIFISFYMAITNMVEKVPSFKYGGTLWFTDLTTPDPMYIFPVLTSLAFLATVELNMQEGMEGNPMVKPMKNFFRVLAFLTVPFTASFPKAIFCYWVTSNLFSLMYGFALRQPQVRKSLDLPALVLERNPTTNLNFNLGDSRPTTPLLPPLTVTEASKSEIAGKMAPSSMVLNHRIRNLEQTVKGRNRRKKR